MKGNENVLGALSRLLTEELTAINQYMVHAEMCENWGYQKLYESVRKRAFTEMRHAEKLIERILFLDAKPIVSELNTVNIGSDVAEQLKFDVAAEYGAIQHYNEAIKTCVEAADNATRDILQEILDDEDAHVDEIEALQSEIEQMGVQVFLTTQVPA